MWNSDPLSSASPASPTHSPRAQPPPPPEPPARDTTAETAEKPYASLTGIGDPNIPDEDAPFGGLLPPPNLTMIRKKPGRGPSKPSKNYPEARYSTLGFAIRRPHRLISINTPTETQKPLLLLPLPAFFPQISGPSLTILRAATAPPPQVATRRGMTAREIEEATQRAQRLSGELLARFRPCFASLSPLHCVVAILAAQRDGACCHFGYARASRSLPAAKSTGREARKGSELWASWCCFHLSPFPTHAAPLFSRARTAAT